MAEIQPFQGVTYNQLRVADLGSVICPPYDVISPGLQEELYRRHDYNFVRIEFGRQRPDDNESDNRYTRATATLNSWLEEGILRVGEAPAVYVHDHCFSCQGRAYRRRGITCLVKLTPWDEMVVRPHEGTLSGPKSDRMNLLRALGVNTSPVMSLFEDGTGEVAAVLDRQSQATPMISIDTLDGESHSLRGITDPTALERIKSALAGRPLYIADGHHRYESALVFQREMRAGRDAPPGQPYDFVMMTLIAFDDPGLVILPAHRLVRDLPAETSAMIIDRLEPYFEIEAFPLEEAEAGRQIDDLLAGENGEDRIIMYGPEGQNLFRLRLRDTGAVSSMIPPSHTGLYARLNVSIVDHVIIEGILGVSPEMAGISVAYEHDGAAAVNRVREGEFQAAFIVNPVRPGDIKAIADSADRMPRKSTYFYPKTPGGLVFYRCR